MASHAIALGVVVVTNNEEDFPGYPGLSVENWVKGVCQGGSSENAQFPPEGGRKIREIPDSSGGGEGISLLTPGPGRLLWFP